MSLGSIQLFSSEYWNSRNLSSDCRLVGSNTTPTRNFTSDKVIFSKSNQVFFWLSFASVGENAPRLAKVSQKT